MICYSTWYTILIVIKFVFMIKFNFNNNLYILHIHNLYILYNMYNFLFFQIFSDINYKEYSSIKNV